MSAEATSLLTVADEAIAEDTTSSWRAVDLRRVMEAGSDADLPTLLTRSDGRCLLYEGKRNELHGPPEAGKTWIALIAALEMLRQARRVAWIDFEDSAGSIVRRLFALGATEADLISNFRYLQPVEPLTQATTIDLKLELEEAGLVVIDAVTEAMAAAGWDPNKNADIAQWYATIPRVAIEAGATCLTLDHVAKDPDRQHGAVGGAHKTAIIDGATYRVDVVKPFGRGGTGVVRVRLSKDRLGYVRGWAVGAKEPPVLDVVIDAHDPEALVVELLPPDANAGEPFKPTHLMEQVSRWVESQPEPVSKRAIMDGVRGKRDYLSQAIEELVVGRFLDRIRGDRGALMHTSKKPYREGIG